MTIYPDEQKARLIERMLPPGQVNVPRLAKETGIPRDTLYGWRRQALRARGLSTVPAAGGGERWSSTEKFAMVVETAALSEVERGEYCRKRGIYPEHLQAWRRASGNLIASIWSLMDHLGMKPRTIAVGPESTKWHRGGPERGVQTVPQTGPAGAGAVVTLRRKRPLTPGWRGGYNRKTTAATPACRTSWR